MRNNLKDSIIQGIVQKTSSIILHHVLTYIFILLLIGGKSYAGYCVGPSDLQCCVKGSPPTSSAYGVDISSQLSSSTASCLASAGN